MLKEAEYVKINKEFKGNKPHTWLNITDKGKTALDNYRKIMQEAVGD
ncbi:transcriptional regulator [candidate division KSB1 bacterium]